MSCRDSMSRSKWSRQLQLPPFPRRSYRRKARDRSDRVAAAGSQVLRTGRGSESKTPGRAGIRHPSGKLGVWSLPRFWRYLQNLTAHPIPPPGPTERSGGCPRRRREPGRASMAMCPVAAAVRPRAWLPSWTSIVVGVRMPATVQSARPPLVNLDRVAARPKRWGIGHGPRGGFAVPNSLAAWACWGYLMRTEARLAQDPAGGQSRRATSATAAMVGLTDAFQVACRP
jgi:hypothetical protein